MSVWKFEWITSWEEVFTAAFQRQWHQWIEHSSTSHVFSHPSLAEAWIETYRPIRSVTPLFVIAENGGSTIFLPLVLWKQNWRNAWRRLIVPVGYSDFDYNAPVVVGGLSDFGSFWEGLASELNSRWASAHDHVDLGGIPGPEAKGNLGWSSSGACPWCDLSAFSDIYSFIASLGNNLRRDLGRRRRRLNELGRVEYHLYAAQDNAKAEEALKPFLARHAQRWPNAYKAPGFHQKLLQRGLAAGIVHFSELRVDGRPLSWHFGFVWNGRYYYYLPAIDGDFANYSPGKVHVLCCIDSAIKSRVRIFDFLRGDESYKSGWASQVLELKTSRWRRSSLRSGAVDLAVNLKAHLAQLHAT